MERIKRFRMALAEKKLDSALVTGRENVRYLSGFTGTAGYLLITEQAQYLVTDFRYLEQAAQQAQGFTIKNAPEFDLKAAAKGCHNTGFEDLSLSYALYARYREHLKKMSPMGRMLTYLRSIKDENEIHCIRRAAEIADQAFSHIVTFMKAGMSELEVALELEFYMRKSGASGLSFDTIVASGARGSLPHGAPTEKLLEPGELVVMDFGCVVDGYCSDMTRTVGIGDVPADQRLVYDTVLRAQLRVLECICAGENCARLHRIAADIIDEAYPGSFGHALGHGVGLEIHEEPTLSPKSDYPLPSGSVVTVEPGAYLPGVCGVRIEDLLVVRADGVENLTHSPKELLII